MDLIDIVFCEFMLPELNFLCGAAMYGSVNRKKKKDGIYKDYYYYHCKHRTTVNGHRCGYKRQQKIFGDNIYQFLLYFDKLYDKFSDAEKKEFLNSFIERVDIYEQEQGKKVLKKPGNKGISI